MNLKLMAPNHLLMYCDHRPHQCSLCSHNTQRKLVSDLVHKKKRQKETIITSPLPLGFIYIL
jgi:hypothetical protein